LATLRRRLRHARIYEGNVADTVLRFRRDGHAPIGAISFDLDYYSSTVAAFRIFDDPEILPRVMCYFDDIAMPVVEAISSIAGERLAISEYNHSHPMQIIDPDWSLDEKASHAYIKWRSQIRIWHDHTHPRGNEYIGTSSPHTLGIAEL
jgi:hypothetical protein